MSTLTTQNSSPLLAIQEEFAQVNETYSKTMSSITKAIKFSNLDDTDEIKQQLVSFAAEQEKIVNYESLSERMLRKVSFIPLIGSSANKSADNLRSQRLSEETVSGIVGKMYQGLKKQAETVEETESRLLQIQQQTKSNLELMITLGKKLNELIANGEIEEVDQSRTLKMKTQIALMTEKSHDKIDSLSLTIPATRAILEAIYQQLPISEADLLSDIAMSTGISQINALAQDVKDMRELSDMVSSGVWAKTQKSIVNLIEINSISDKEITRIEETANKRAELYQNTIAAAAKQQKQSVEAAKKIELIVQKSDERRTKTLSYTPEE